MASYHVRIKPSAAKELERIPVKTLRRITRRIANLAMNPRPAGCEKLAGQARVRVRQGDYRIVFSIDDGGQVVEVVKVGHRRELYR